MKHRRRNIYALVGALFITTGLAVAACNPVRYYNGNYIEIPPCANDTPPTGWTLQYAAGWTCCDQTNLCDPVTAKRKLRWGWVYSNGSSYCWVYWKSEYDNVAPCCGEA